MPPVLLTYFRRDLLLGLRLGVLDVVKLVLEAPLLGSHRSFLSTDRELRAILLVVQLGLLVTLGHCIIIAQPMASRALVCRHQSSARPHVSAGRLRLAQIGSRDGRYGAAMAPTRPANRSLLAKRLAAQRLSGPAADDAVHATRHLLAVQAQDPRGARLALRARVAGGGASAVDRALTSDRSLVITWANRGTLHLIAAEDEPLLHALTTPQLHSASNRRLTHEGVSPAAGAAGSQRSSGRWATMAR